MRGTGQPEFGLFSESENRFYVGFVDAEGSFLHDKDGAIDRSVSALPEGSRFLNWQSAASSWRTALERMPLRRADPRLITAIEQDRPLARRAGIAMFQSVPASAGNAIV